jgi:hypothetical protein
MMVIAKHVPFLEMEQEFILRLFGLNLDLRKE